MLNIEAMIKRVAVARKNKLLWQDHLRECYRYTIPDKQTFDEFSRGQRKHEYVFDSTAVVGVAKYANRMQGQLVPPWQNWLKLEAGTEIPKEQKAQVDEYLEEATKVLFDHINHSNFNAQIHETFLDLAISTGCIIVEEGDGVKSALNFRSVSLSDVLLEDTSKGIVDNVWRELKIPVKDITSIWKKAVLNDDLKRLLSEKPTEEVKLIEGVVYNENTRTYSSMVFSEQYKHVIFEEDLTTSPYIVFRESVISGEVIGRGRVMTLLNDIKTLNKIVEYNLNNAALAASGIYTAEDDGVINPYNIVIAPNSIIPVGSNDSSRPTLAPLPRAGDFNLTQLEIRDLRDGIKEYLYNEPFGKISDTPVRSATEMSMRGNDFQESTNAAFAKLQTELLDRLITRCVDILKKAGKIADMKIDGKEVTIKFTSPSARIQDRDELGKVAEFGQYMQFLPPEVIEREINFGNVTKHIREKLGLPVDFQYTDEEKQAMAQQEQQQQDQMMQQQQQQVDIEQQKADDASGQ